MHTAIGRPHRLWQGLGRCSLLLQNVHMRSFTEYSALRRSSKISDLRQRRVLELVTLGMAKALAGKIHIIDDDPTVRDSLSLLLSFMGYRTRAWPSGDQFLAEQPLEPSDIVLVDMIMPGEDGGAVMRTLRDKKLFNPVILMTGDASPTLGDRAPAEYSSLLYKPFSKDSLQQAINMAVSGEP